MRHTVYLAACARREWPWLPLRADAGDVLVGPAGPVLRVRDDGGCDVLLPGGYPRPGPAGDPCAQRGNTTLPRWRPAP